jgi:hypothetical protein
VAGMVRSSIKLTNNGIMEESRCKAIYKFSFFEEIREAQIWGCGLNRAGYLAAQESAKHSRQQDYRVLPWAGSRTGRGRTTVNNI